MSSYNWSHIDEEAMKRADPRGYKKWRIVQMLTYGLSGERLDRSDVMEFWPEIKDELDLEIQRLVEFLLWGKVYSVPINRPSWNRPRGIRA